MIRVHLKHLGVAFLWIAASFVLAGCYTVLKHPQVVSEAVPEEGVQQSQRCTDCHSRLHRDDYYSFDPFYERYRWSYYDPFWMRGPLYSRSYYSQWWYYNAYPWWRDRSYYDYYWYDDPYYVPSKTNGYREKEVVEEERRTWGRRSGFSEGGGGATYSVEPRIGSGTAGEIREKEVPEARPSSSTARPSETEIQKRTKSASSTPSRPAVTPKKKDSDTKKDEKSDSDSTKKKRSSRRKGMD